jgi:DeoR/GlpR family transcriptional regulator of sugar metabolism
MTNEQKILNALTEHSELTKGELRDICKVTESEIYLALNALASQKLIKWVKQGVYALDKTNFIDPKQTSLF